MSRLGAPGGACELTGARSSRKGLPSRSPNAGSVGRFIVRERELASSPNRDPRALHAKAMADWPDGGSIVSDRVVRRGHRPRAG